MSNEESKRTVDKRASEIGVRLFSKKFLIGHIRRMGLLIITCLFNHDLVYAAIGFLNRYFKVIESVFLAYPASEKYALSYVYKWRLTQVQWSPFPVGLLFQNGKFTLMFVVSSNDAKFLTSENEENLRQLAGRMEKIRNLLGANTKTFAGILAGLLYKRGIVQESPEADVTAKVVTQAVIKVIVREELTMKVPIVVLGGNGFIGKKVVALLKADGFDVYPVDLNDEWPGHLSNRRCVLVNITVRKELEKYIDRLWPGVVVVNEVYPEPSPAAVARLKSQGCQCYHIAGVQARAFPSFPLAYRGGIPCCAAWDSPEVEARVIKF